MLDRKLSTTQCCQEVDFLLEEQIVLLSLEPLMRLLLNNNNNISRGDTRRLVALSTEVDRLSTAHTFIDMHLEHLLLRHNFLAITRLALVFMIDNLARPRTFITRLLQLLDHRTHLAQRDLDSASTASPTLPHGAFLATLTITLAADDVAREREFRRLALVQVFEGDVDAVDKIFGFAGSLLS